MLLVASLYGQLLPEPEPVVRYTQHATPRNLPPQLNVTDHFGAQPLDADQASSLEVSAMDETALGAITLHLNVGGMQRTAIALWQDTQTGQGPSGTADVSLSHPFSITEIGGEPLTVVTAYLQASEPGGPQSQTTVSPLIIWETAPRLGLIQLARTPFASAEGSKAALHLQALREELKRLTYACHAAQAMPIDVDELSLGLLQVRMELIRFTDSTGPLLVTVEGGELVESLISGIQAISRAEAHWRSQEHPQTLAAQTEAMTHLLRLETYFNLVGS
jgi:hypothetical protein